MKLLFLGTGTSSGVPVLGCRCQVCTSRDPRDNRMRTAALLTNGDTRILIDAGPDIRQQLLPLDFRPLDAILLTHIHYDHVGGLDDLKVFSRFGDQQIYADERTCEGVKRVMPYCFKKVLYPHVPHLNLHTISPHEAFRVKNVEVMPIQVMHDQMPILGYRFGRLAYITDIKTIHEEEIPYLEGVETLVVGALRWDRPHHSHFLVGDAIEFSRQLGAKRTYLVHMTHAIGPHAMAQKRLPEGVFFAYDGQEITI